MCGEHKYLFHPSILRASRQIELEASHILYNENSLVRVSTCTLRYWVEDGFRLRGIFDRHSVPILATFERAHNFTRHTMNLVMFREDRPSERMRAYKNKFVIAGDDLKRFCYSLLMLNDLLRAKAKRLILAIEVFTERIAAIVAPYEKDDTLIDGEDLLRGNCSIEATTSTKDHDLIPSELSLVGKAPTEVRPPTLHQAVSANKHAASIVSSPRVMKLLEPLRKLHSLHGAYIKGPIRDDYRTALLRSLLGPPPGDLECFDELLTKFKDAMSTYDRGDQEAGLVKLKLTLDTLKDQMSARANDWSGHIVIPQGAPYAGYTVRNAQRDIEIQVWTKLAWKLLKIRTNPHVSVAQHVAHLCSGCVVFQTIIGYCLRR